MSSLLCTVFDSLPVGRLMMLSPSAKRTFPSLVLGFFGKSCSFRKRRPNSPPAWNHS
ncbi:uncharacterized protein LOC143020044 isoform X2 [Oratosquilla oratoria]|uniref:uncharacterized protein LOC143020044 isoform X2 n=1 Tax=Oratosquilla oratoria TaxID=337810 RepID=UPI003F768389